MQSDGGTWDFQSISCCQKYFYLERILLTDREAQARAPYQHKFGTKSVWDLHPSEAIQISSVRYSILWETWMLSVFMQRKVSSIQRQTKMFSVFEKQKNTKTTLKALQ